MPTTLHHRSLSRDIQATSHTRPRSPSPPTQTFHPSIMLPTPSLVESVAGGAHYAGVRVDSDAVLKHRRSSSRPHTQLAHHHERVLDDLTELYCCRPTLEILERSWSKDAVFEDPFSKCKGYNEYAARWFALPKLITHAEQISKRVMSSTDNPNQFIYFQTQEYTIRFLKKKKIVESIITVDLDENEKIIRLVDQWGGNSPPTRYGAAFFRTLNAKISPWLFHVPKHPHDHAHSHSQSHSHTTPTSETT